MSTVGNARSSLSPAEVSLAGAASGAITRLICQPLDVAKIRLQLQAESGGARKYPSLVKLLLKMPREEGLRALWKGHVPAQVLSVTYGLASFAVFESLAARLNSEELEQHPERRALVHILCGSAGGCAGTLLSYPADVLRTRLVAQSRPVYRGSLDGSRLLYSEAGLATFYRGITAACMAVAPQSGLQFGLYSLATNLLATFVTKTDLTLGEDVITVQGSLLCGAMAGVATKTILYPLDVVKKRLQVSGWSEGRAGLGETPRYSSMRDCVSKIVRQEGGRALYKGFTPALIKAVSTTSIHFMSWSNMMNSLIFNKLRPRVPRFNLTQLRQCSEASEVRAQPQDWMADKLFKQIDLELRAHEPAVLKSYSWFAGAAAKELNIKLEKSWAPPEPHKERKTLLKAAYVNKKHRVQYEMRTFYHFITLKQLTGSTADTYLEYIQRNLPEGVSMKVIKHEVRRLLPEVSEQPGKQHDN